MRAAAVAGRLQDVGHGPPLARRTPARRVSAAIASIADRRLRAGRNGADTARTTAPSTSKATGTASTAATIIAFVATRLTIPTLLISIAAPLLTLPDTARATGPEAQVAA
jgi:hypothetical protein